MKQKNNKLIKRTAKVNDKKEEELLHNEESVNEEESGMYFWKNEVPISNFT